MNLTLSDDVVTRHTTFMTAFNLRHVLHSSKKDSNKKPHQIHNEELNKLKQQREDSGSHGIKGKEKQTSKPDVRFEGNDTESDLVDDSEILELQDEDKNEERK